MPHKAFVSSTYDDLAQHRAKVIEALRQAGIQVDPMEVWTASSDEPKKFCQERVDDCDLCVLLVALRRGYVPEGEDLSITQLEYEAALRRGQDVLVFLLDEDAPWLRRFDELDVDPGLRSWRAALMKRHGVSFFGLDPDSLQIEPALLRWLSETKNATAPGVAGQPVAGRRAPGALRIVDVQVTQDPEPKRAEDLKPAKCLVDLFVSNDGGSQVIITAVELSVVDTARCELIKGRLESSQTYDLDLTPLRKVGDRATVPTSQVVDPGQSDRFTLRLVATGLGSGVFGLWILQPTLKTNFGEIAGPTVEVWLPYRDPDATLEEMKGIEAMMQGARRHP